MPYKAKNIEFGANKHVLDTDMMRDYTENLILALDLQRQPVGVRILNDQEEFDALDAPVVKGKMSYCQMIERASKGRLYKSRLENHSCDGATTALAQLCEHLTATGTRYPNTDLLLHYETKTSH